MPIVDVYSVFVIYSLKSFHILSLKKNHLKMKFNFSLLLLLVWSLSLNAQTTAVGSTEGVFNVSDLGGANYTIPIKVPEGIGGVQPSLSINYSSQGGNGIMGMGWSLSSGASIITRVTE
jgi:hypothetical protein